MDETHAEHFESLDVQAHASRLGMWVFLSSEMLLFAGLFALFAASRAADPAGFHEEVLHNTRVLGSTNTLILLASSTTAASGVRAVRERHKTSAVWLFVATIVMGGIFLVIKFVEYAKHFSEGIYPGGQGSYFAAPGAATHSLFWTLYYVMTGLHAIHVFVGMVLLATVATGIGRGNITADRSHRADIGAMYWHLIDLIWIFLWPLLYLA